jgi:hypothetical protein
LIGVNPKAGSRRLGFRTLLPPNGGARAKEVMMVAPNKARSAASDLAADAFEGVNAMLSEAADRSRVTMEASLAAWTEETQRFYDELALQGQVALDQLKKCQSPLEVLNIEQAWVAARSKAYLESGLRFAQTFAAIAQGRTGSAADGGSAPKAS